MTALATVRADPPRLADLGYEGAADIIHVPVKKKAGQHKLSDDQHPYNKLLRGVGERANAQLTATFKTLRRFILKTPWNIGKITQAALVPLYRGNNRTPPPSHNVTFDC